MAEIWQRRQSRPIANPGPPGPGNTGPVTVTFVDPAELIQRYGPILKPRKRTVAYAALGAVESKEG